MTQARSWSDDQEEDVHKHELTAIFKEIDLQAHALGATGFGIMPDVSLERSGSFYHNEREFSEASDVLKAMIADVYVDLDEQELWKSLLIGSEEYTIVARRVLDTNFDPLGVIGLFMDPAKMGPNEAMEVCRRVAALTERMLGMWSNRLRLELEILAERRRGDRLQRYAERDPLTRSCNAVTFRMLAEEMISDGNRLNALMVLDVDNFKAVNDVFGHSFGDRYLQQIARAMELSLPRGSLIGRIGGDEFAALVPAPTAIATAAKSELRVPGEWMQKYCVEVMERCVAQIKRSVEKLGKADLGNITIGAAIHPIQAKSLDQLFEFADAAVYSNKGKGAKKVPAVFKAEEHDAFSNRLLGARFQKAVAQGHIRPYLQPIVALGENRISAFEALARWYDPNRGLLLPEDFRQVFFDPDMAMNLSRTMIRTTLEWLAERWEMAPSRHERVAINLTTFELIDDAFIGVMDETLDAVGLPWSSMMIEVTERVMLGPINGPVFRSLLEMRGRGALIALDDFGTGYGGLQHLTNWPVDILKIDHSFLSGGAESDGYRPIVRAIADMAEEMGFDVVAEGIETENSEQFITDLGCSAGQGKYFSEAMPLDVMKEVLQEDTDWSVLAPRFRAYSSRLPSGRRSGKSTETALSIARNGTGLRRTIADDSRYASARS